MRQAEKYYGHGPIQLSWNYNYDPAQRAIRVDLLNNKDLVTMDPTVLFKMAVWFWMMAQSNKPLSHAVITGQWTPSGAGNAAGRVLGYGVITNIINGGLELAGGRMNVLLTGSGPTSANMMSSEFPMLG